MLELLKELDGISKKKHSDAFGKPVSENWPAIWNDYKLRIKNPLCLDQMKAKLENNMYSDIRAFMNDIELIVDNCISYYRQGTTEPDSKNMLHPEEFLKTSRDKVTFHII